jgi:hypothetical protein
LLRISTTSHGIEVADSSGTVLQSIQTSGTNAVGAATTHGAPGAEPADSSGTSMGRGTSTDSSGVAMRDSGFVPSRPGAEGSAGNVGGHGDAGDKAMTVAGQWNGQKLVVQRPGRDGMMLTQTYALENGGRTLVIRTTMPASGDHPARDFKRVYTKV